jgi:hypothetical protein
MAKKIPFKPGQLSPGSGQAAIIDSNGNKTGEERTVTKGEPFPPTPRKGQTYRPVDPTKNKSGFNRYN